MPSRFLITTPIPESGMRLPREAGHVTVLPAAPDPAKLAGLCAGGDFDVVVTQLGDTRLAPGLADLPNTVLLPHIGSATVPVRARMSTLSAENAIAMAAGRLPEFCVNPEALAAR
ncbi:hypothetical protein [Specibacter sp. RAF43]|uniref:hypothetical protein n=1 Tax=Specibacter sp. RAF43 TaxID=3233057 RepID=UPI003F98439A